MAVEAHGAGTNGPVEVNISVSHGILLDGRESLGGSINRFVSKGRPKRVSLTK